MMIRVGAVVLGGVLLLAGCTDGGQEPAQEGPSAPSADASGTLTVWLMKGSQPQSVIDAVNEAFAELYPNVDVQVELQQWLGIQDRLLAALDSTSTPDVVEIGNSLTARFADAGLLAALDGATFDVDQMLPGARPSGELDGTRFGIPYYGGVRLVVYRKSDFAKADVEVPTTLAELEEVAAKLQESRADDKRYSAFYFPGRYWYGAIPFIWDAGGEIAVREGDRWTGTLDSVESRAGLATLQDLVDKYSKAPTDVDERNNVEAFATGNVGMMIDSWWVPGALDVGELKGDIGAFVLPGTGAEESAPVFFGGSDVAVAGNSANQGLAVEWLKLLTGVEIQTRLAKQGGVIPNQEGAFVGHEGNPFLQVADRAATVSRFTPVAPTWGNVESSGILPDMLEQILSGTATIEQATAAASEALTATLNG